MPGLTLSHIKISQNPPRATQPGSPACAPTLRAKQSLTKLHVRPSQLYFSSSIAIHMRPELERVQTSRGPDMSALVSQTTEA